MSDDPSDGATAEEVLDRLDGIETSLERLDEREDVELGSHRRELGEVRRLVEGLSASEFVTESIVKYTPRDVAEAFVGALVFSVPLLVEDGVFTIAAHFLDTSVAGVPVYLVANAVLVVVVVTGVIYWADFRQVRVNRPLFGVIPRRLVGVLVVSFLTAATTMTVWGRLDGWADPAVALARVSVVWTAAALGASLGDILPGESTGSDLADVVEGLG